MDHSALRERWQARSEELAARVRCERHAGGGWWLTWKTSHRPCPPSGRSPPSTNRCQPISARAGTGSLYPSQHKLLPLFKKGSAAHVNNIAVGTHGRHRSNLWTYPAGSVGSDAQRGRQDDPTVKPTSMLEDALADLTNPGETVLDPFLGSGSTVLAADNTGRVCCGVELDPLYVDVMIRRFQAATGAAAILACSGETFEQVATRRRDDETPIALSCVASRPGRERRFQHTRPKAFRRHVGLAPSPDRHYQSLGDELRFPLEVEILLTSGRSFEPLRKIGFVSRGDPPLHAKIGELTLAGERFF
jgi:hypothetical protein